MTDLVDVGLRDRDLCGEVDQPARYADPGQWHRYTAVQILSIYSPEKENFVVLLILNDNGV